ncbi:hypothetical protein LWI29_032537 [Acer saccharum]|uniref:Retrotransposon gag domain-containing protein n=1 Tax=Acer saccharum TaxID=4024 RepID=A0AA39W3C3_ACESA|nr:hypothetical protein LWI29_032537 [Acer saccharum]
MARRYGRNVSSDDELGSPFIESITRTQFPDRFRMPTIEQYKENKDPKKHICRFRNIMAQYSSNDGLLCLMFPQTFGDLASRWFGRLPPGSINSFSSLSKAFISYVHGHKPDSKSEHKDDRKAQSRDRQKDEKNQKRQPREGRGNNRTSRFRGRYSHYTPLTGDQEEILSIVEDKGLVKYPRQQSNNARRDTTKYCRFHKDHGHDTLKCFRLRDHIESLIREGHLKDFTLKEDKHGGRQDSRQGSGQERKSPRRSSPGATINTIFGGPHTGRSNRERMSKVREVMYEGRNMEINSMQRNPKKGREGHDPITFTAEDSDGIDAKPNDAIVVGVQIAHRDVLRVMIDNGSSTDILSARVYDELRLDRKDLEPFHVPLKGFEATSEIWDSTVPTNNPTGFRRGRHSQLAI